MARATIDRSEFSPADWRGLAKHLREMALGMMDDKTRARMNKQAQEYEMTADRLEATGSAPAPNQEALGAMPADGMGSGLSQHGKSRLFRRMLEWRPSRLKHG
jgi:hypothetical protein